MKKFCSKRTYNMHVCAAGWCLPPSSWLGTQQEATIVVPCVNDRNVHPVAMRFVAQYGSSRRFLETAAAI